MALGEENEARGRKVEIVIRAFPRSLPLIGGTGLPLERKEGKGGRERGKGGRKGRRKEGRHQTGKEKGRKDRSMAR